MIILIKFIFFVKENKILTRCELRGKNRTLLRTRLEPRGNKLWRFASRGPKLLFTIALSMGLKTHYMITKAFTTSTIA